MCNMKFIETMSPKRFLEFFKVYYNAVLYIKQLYKTPPKEWDEAYKINPIKK